MRGQRGRGARNVSALTETEGADALEEWKENGGYGKRWIVEIILSAFKRLWKRRACAEMGQHGPGDQTKGVGLQHADRYGIGECRPGAARADPALRPSGNCICTGGSFAVCASPLPPPPPPNHVICADPSQDRGRAWQPRAAPQHCARITAVSSRCRIIMR